MAMSKIKKGDSVVAIAGRDRNKQGIVSEVSKTRVLVDGINLVKKHQKPNPEKNIQGGIIEKEAWMDISNIAIVNPQTNKADRVGFKMVGDKKVRYLKSDGEVIDV
jgi:large subunit ribosomal protein L24